MILEELFTTMAEFRSYAPYLESNVDFKHLNSSAGSARKQICIVLTKEVYTDILSQTDHDDCKNELRKAMANLTLAKQMVFDVISQRKNEIDIYKHEQESMRRAYTDNYFNAMDSVIQLLEDDDGISEHWKATKRHALIDKLKLKTASDFDAAYPIDMSYLFFFRTVPLQMEALDEYVGGYYDRASGKDEVLRMLDRALAKITVSIALRRFDIIEFPPTIRSLFDDSKASRSGRDEQNRMLEMAASLYEEAKALLSDIDLLLSEEGEEQIVTETSFNRPDDKIYLMA